MGFEENIGCGRKVSGSAPVLKKYEWLVKVGSFIQRNWLKKYSDRSITVVSGFQTFSNIYI